MKHTEYPHQKNSRYDNKSPDEIEEEIGYTRAEMSDTLHALERKLSPGQWIDQTLGYFRGAGEESGEFAANLGRSIKGNPAPIALLGISLGWLMMGGSERSERRHSRTYREPYRGPIATSSTATTTTTQRGPIVTPSGKTAGSGEVRSGYKEKARHTAHETRERAEHLAHGAREKMGEVAEAAHHQAEHLGDMAHYQAEQARRGFAYMLQEHPLVLGSIGIAVGAVLGAGLPPTRREDEFMGGKRDEFLEHTEAMGREQLYKAEHVAKAAQEAAREEAQRQGLTPEVGKEQLHQAQQKVERVAGVAQEAAKEEAKRQDFGSLPSGSRS